MAYLIPLYILVLVLASTVWLGGEVSILLSFTKLKHPKAPLPNEVLAGPVVTPIPPISNDAGTELGKSKPAWKIVPNKPWPVLSYMKDDIAAVAKTVVVARARLEDEEGAPGDSQVAKFKLIVDEIARDDGECTRRSALHWLAH